MPDNHASDACTYGAEAPPARYVIPGPGAYDMPAATYHADPAPLESLSSTGAKTLADPDSCPAAFRYERDNRENKRCFDIGTATHLLVLEPHLFESAIVVVRGKTKDGKPSRGYTTDDAVAQRDAAYDAGKTPLLPDELAMVMRMRDALRDDPIAAAALENAYVEKSLFWQDKATGIWCRSRPDIIGPNLGYTINLKTAEQVGPAKLFKEITNLGYFQSAAWELDGLENTLGQRPPKAYLLVVGKKEPHRILTVEISEVALKHGTMLNEYARGIFAWCQARGEWPGFRPKIDEPPRAFVYDLPYWKMVEINERWESGSLKAPAIPEPGKDSEANG